MVKVWDFVEQDRFADGRVETVRHWVIKGKTRDEALRHALQEALCQYAEARAAPFGVVCLEWPDGTTREWRLVDG